MSRSEEFEQGLGRFSRLQPDELDDEHVGEKATLIEGPRRWRGTLARHWQTGSMGLNIGAKTRRSIDDWRGHVVEIGPDAEARFKHWKAHGSDAPGPGCYHCARGTNPPGVKWP